jgi:hypothetical protein
MISSHLKYSEEDFLKQAVELYQALGLSGDVKKVQTIKDIFHDIYNDGRKYGQAKAIEDMGHDIQGVLSDFEDYDGDE